MTNPVQSELKSKSDEALQWVKSQKKEMESLLQALVEQSSWTYDKPGVDAASQILLKSVPLTHSFAPSKKYGDQNIFHNRLRASSSGILLIGHIDTVFPKNKFSGYRAESNIARGPGVLDMKGGLVIIAFALQSLKRAGLLDSIPLTFLVVTEEEVGSPESTPLLQGLAQGASASLVFESGRKADAIITRRKGTGSFTAIAKGRAAHAGNAHQEGANAIWAMSRFVDRVQGLTDYAKGNTLNVGKITGGMGSNTVPDLSEAQVDLRYISQNDVQELRKKIETTARDSAISGTQIEIQWGPCRDPMEKTPESEMLLQLYAEGQKLSGLGDGECELVGGGSDAATTSQAGVPSIDGLGPRGTGFHTVEEYIELDSMIPKAQALIRYLSHHSHSFFKGIGREKIYE